jgi:hypothetical protein
MSGRAKSESIRRPPFCVATAFISANRSGFRIKLPFKKQLDLKKPLFKKACSKKSYIRKLIPITYT